LLLAGDVSQKCRTRQRVAVPLGSRDRPEQVAANAKTVDGKLSPAELEEIDRISASPVMV